MVPTTLPIKRAVVRAVRRGLKRYVRAQPRADAERCVTILLASAWGLGGTIRTTLNFAGFLAGHYKVEILSLYRRREEPFFAFPEGVRVTALDDLTPSPLTRVRGVVEHLLRGRSSVLMSPHDRGLHKTSLWTDLVMVRALRGRAGVLISTRPGLNLLAADLSPPGLILVGQEHMHLASHSKALRRAFKRSYPRLDALVVLTQRDRRCYEQLFDGRVRLATIPNTVRPDLGPPARLTHPRVLAAGRLGNQKGFDMLIRAFADVQPRHPDWSLVICGAGPWRGRLQRLIARFDLHEAVTLAGPVEPLSAEIDKASIYALSSRFEGLPLVLLEAMAKGLAVAAFDCPTGPREVIEDGRNGLLVPPADIAGLAAAIETLMSDPELRRRLGAAAARSAQAFTMSAVGPQWLRLLNELGVPARIGHSAVAGGPRECRVQRTRMTY